MLPLALVLSAAGQSRSVVLTGTAHLTAGSLTRQGPAHLEAESAPGAAPSVRIEFDFGDGQYLETAADATCPPRHGCAARQAAWSDQSRDSATHARASQPAEPAWFFPAWGRWQQTPPGITLTDLGACTHNGVAARHLHLAGAGGGEISDVFLDPSTGLARAVQFTLAADNGRGPGLAVEVRYSDYRLTGGAEVPFQVQRYYNGVLNLELTLDSATFGGALPDAEFTLAGGGQ